MTSPQEDLSMEFGPDGVWQPEAWRAAAPLAPEAPPADRVVTAELGVTIDGVTKMWRTEVRTNGKPLIALKNAVSTVAEDAQGWIYDEKWARDDSR
jgi:hypothetical protein